jgi:hypothetical protein
MPFDLFHLVGADASGNSLNIGAAPFRTLAIFADCAASAAHLLLAGGSRCGIARGLARKGRGKQLAVLAL